VHFPIVLAIVAVVADIRTFHDGGYRLTGWAAVAAALAVLTGFQMGGGRIESSVSVLHVGSALLGTLSLIVLAALRYSAKARDEDVSESYPTAWLILGIFAALVIAMAAITGHRFVLLL